MAINQYLTPNHNDGEGAEALINDIIRLWRSDADTLEEALAMVRDEKELNYRVLLDAGCVMYRIMNWGIAKVREAADTGRNIFFQAAEALLCEEAKKNGGNLMKALNAMGMEAEEDEA